VALVEKKKSRLLKKIFNNKTIELYRNIQLALIKTFLFKLFVFYIEIIFKIENFKDGI